ncbi:MAG: glycosyltransferase [Saprospiraceae bacterium]|nr:glycosyltransferase [Saprospiraceae bacterium]
MARKAIQQKISHTVASELSVSVIICTHNTLNTLQPLLHQVLEQQYPTFECIVVDDGSTDGTSEWLKSLTQNNPNLKILYQDPSAKTLPGKKQALEKGILAASGEIILLTDSDCVIPSRDWISSMLKPFNHKTDVVLGFAPLKPAETMAASMSSLESLLTAMQYGSYATIGMPYMGVGRNMAYRRSLIKGNSPFALHKDIPSGDDDLFIRDLQSEVKIRIQTEEESLVYSYSPDTWSGWYRQKSRHVQTSLRYSFRHQIILSLFALSHLLYYLIVLLGFICGFVIPALAAMVIRWLILLLPYRNWARLIKFGPGWKLYPFFDLFLSLYYIILFPGLFFKRKTW